MKELTKAEEQIMKALWSIEKGFVSDIIEALPKPRPAYTTVATIIRILEKKNFVSHKVYGKNNEYYPLLQKDVYTENQIKSFTKNYFNSSFSQMISFFAKGQDMPINDLEEIKNMIENEINNKR